MLRAALKIHSISAPRDRILKYLNEVDIRRGPIERTVTTMVRLKAADWSSPKQERKDYIYYEEDWLLRIGWGSLSPRL